MKRLLAAILVVSLPTTAWAEVPQPAWPVRLTIAMPIGSTWGTERVHGFSWGFRSHVQAFIKPHGPALGGYLEMLLDAKTHGATSAGLSAGLPVLRIVNAIDWNVTAYGGLRWINNEDAHRINLGIGTSFNFPFYLYQAGLGVRVDTTLRNGSFSAVSLLVDVDLVLVLGLIGYAAGSK